MQDFRRLLRVLLAVLPLGVAVPASAQNTVATDKAALVALYNAADGANWTTNTNWTSEEPLSSWFGVTTNSAGRVTALVLNGNGLEGTLPAALGDLGELEQLDLQNNALGGALPTELADLTNLTSLLLNESRALTGPLPAGLRELSDLETVNIEKTELCAPEDDAFRTWLDSITFTGLICPPAEQSVIDLAVFYTSAAREELGGIDEIETSIDLMVAETNTAYATSGVNQRIKLVAVEEVVGYTQGVDTGLGASFTDLRRLQSSSDGYMDEVHDIRDTVGADIVLLVRSGFVNQANLGGPSTSFESVAFGVVTPDNAGSFAHELGHIMGLLHDRYAQCGVEGCNSTRFPYSFGYVNQRAFDPNDPESPNPDPTVPATARWYTIMAYASQCTAARFSCRELLRFSNPDQIHPDPGGDALGKAGLEPLTAVGGPSDAVRMLNRTRGYVANFRSPPDIMVSFGAAQYTAAEGGAAATVTVRLSAAPTRAIDIPFTATGATGAAVEDYTVPLSVAFAADDTEQTFTVTAVDDDVDDDGETVTLTLGHLLPGGVGAGSPATATVALTDNDTVTGAPSVASVLLTSDPGVAYAAGEEIEVTVRFDKTVMVTGTPQLGLTVGSDTWQASYQGGAREVMTFSYEVDDDESDTDGISIAADSLTLNGGTIQDGANQDATLTHDALADDANHRVDGVKPTLLEAVVDEAVLTLTYDEPLAQPAPQAASGFSVASIHPPAFGPAREVVVQGSIVTVTLRDPVLAGEEVTVRFLNVAIFGRPSLIRDLAGNRAAGLFDREVTNVTEERVYDIDADGLIEVTTLAQLDAIRHDPDGDGAPTNAGANAYREAFPDAFLEADSQLRCVLECRGYELMADLDFDTDGDGDVDLDDDYWNNGAGWNPLGSGTDFAATFEGNGHTLRHLFIDRPTTLRVGLFGDTDWTCAIRNVGVTHVDVTGATYVGGLVGESSCPITASYATGRVSGSTFVGGLVGYNTSRIEASYATVRVSGTWGIVGGLVGLDSGTIIGNYATGRVSGGQRVGGLVGTKGANRITDGYATGRVTGTSDVGGLTGVLDDLGRVYYSYWDTLTSGQATGSNGQGKTTTELQSPTDNTGIYADWDDDQWDFGEADEYPVLAVDFDGDSDTTWEEFGYQLREGPALMAEAGVGQVVLSWTAVDASHWNPAPAVTYTLYREDGATVEAIAENLTGLGYTDTEVTAGETYTYQVAAVVTGGEATRSALKTIEPALPNMWLSPTESDPVASVRSAATYSVTFQGTWTTTVTSGGLPSGAHFTTLIGGVHNAAVTFLSEGGMASAGVESMAELGGTGTLASEVRAARPNALSVLQGSGGNIGPASSSTIKLVTLTTDHPRVTLLSMVAPSPDWFVGVSGLSLLDAQGDWLASRALNLYPWDAGTEEGSEFSLNNAATSPQGVITSLRGMGKFSNAPIATLTFTRQSINTAPSITSDTSFEVDENRTAVATLTATDNDTASDQLTWSIPSGDAGGADADHFALSSTGVLAFSRAKDYENPDDADADRTYEVTVQVSDGANPVEADLIVSLLDVDDAAPALSSATVNGATLRLTYDEPVDGSSTPASGDFTVSGGDHTRTVTRVSVSGSTVLLTLDPGAEHLESGIRVSYTPGANPIRDVPGNQAEGLSREPVTNETPDTTPPEVSSLAISSNPGSDQTYAAEDVIEVMVSFNETVKVEGTPRLRLRVGSRNRPADYLSGTDTAVLVFGYEVADGDEDTDGVSVEANRLTLNGGTIKDEADNAAELAHEAVAAQAGHRVDGVRPAFVSAAVDGASLALTYGEALDEGSRPATGDFTVEMGGSGRSVTGVSVSGSVLTLFLNPAVEHGDTGIRVSYTVPTGVGANPIRDAVGNDARGLSNRSVTNTTDAPNTAPEITSPGSISVPENRVVARRLAARDSDPGDEVTGWAIVGGADQGQFAIASDTGELSFREAPDYEDPVDAAGTAPVSGAGDNEYVVTVQVRSGAGARELTAEQTLTITVTDEPEPPAVPEAPTFSGETAGSLQVSWSEPDNTGPAITDYDVQYREEGTRPFTDALHEGPGRTLTLSDLKEGTVYEVQVRAANDEGTGDWSPLGEGMTVTPLTLMMASDPEPPVSGPFRVRFSFSEPVTGFSGNDVDSKRDPECRDDQNNTIFCDPGIGGLETTDDRIFTTTVTPWTDRVAHSYTLSLSVPADTVTSVASGQPNEEAMLEVRVSPPGAPELISSMGSAGEFGQRVGEVELEPALG